MVDNPISIHNPSHNTVYHSIYYPKYMLLVGHRGAPKAAPENTILSLNTAFELGANAVEFDVRMTRDGVPVLFHDAWVLRRAKRLRRISKLSLGRVRTLNVGKGQSIPTLDEALAAVGGKGALLVEFKRRGMEAMALPLLNGTPHVIAISYLADVLANLKAMDARLTTGLLFKKNKPNHFSSWIDAAKAIGAEWILGRSDVVTPELVETAHKSGIRVDVWVVNGEAEMRRFRSLGVDAITSDYPDRFKSLAT